MFCVIRSRPSDHYFCSVCLSVCLCRVFLSRLRSDLDQTRTHVTCPGLVVSPRMYGLCDTWGLGDPPKLYFRGFRAVVNHHSVAANFSTLFFHQIQISPSILTSFMAVNYGVCLISECGISAGMEKERP